MSARSLALFFLIACGAPGKPGQPKYDAGPIHLQDAGSQAPLGVLWGCSATSVTGNEVCPTLGPQFKFWMWRSTMIFEDGRSYQGEWGTPNLLSWTYDGAGRYILFHMDSWKAQTGTIEVFEADTCGSTVDANCWTL